MMRFNLNQCLRVTFIGLIVGTVLSLFHTGFALAQAAFLISPYYNSTIINQGFSTTHPAYDYNLYYTQVIAADAGTVTRVQWYNNSPECHGPVNNYDCGYGLHIYIQHSNSYVTRYAHLSSAAFALNTTSAAVQAGQIIGTSGNTGNSTGPHLHFEVKNATGGNVDPTGSNLWKDGQWASPSRPIPAPVNGGEIQVDDTTNNSGGFSKGNGGPFNNPCTNDCGGWTRNTNMYYASVNGNTQNSWARWQPTLPVDDAIYEIMVYIPNVAANTTTWQASYTIQHEGGPSTAVIDQVGSRGQWISIGTYRMKIGQTPAHSIYVTDASGEVQGTHCGANVYCTIGVDAVKFIRRGVTYAPDVRYSSSGWQSSLIIRNNGGGPATTYTRFFKSDGTNACTLSVVTLVAHQTNSVTCGSSQVASAVVEGSQDLSVVVRTVNGGLAHLDNTLASGSTVDPAFEQIGTTLYVPAIYKNIFGGLTSTVHVQNASNNASNQVTLTYIPRPGQPACNPCNTQFTLLLNGKLSQAASTFVAAASSVGSLVITAQSPVAVAIEESQGATVSRSFSAVANGHLRTYVPAAYNNQFGFLTGLVIQNLHASSSTNVTLTYYDRFGAVSATQQISNLASKKAVGVNLSTVPGLPNMWSGSVKIESSGSIPLGTAVTNSNTAGGYDFNATNKGSKVVVLPFAVKSSSGTACSWCTGYTVRNVSTSSNVTVVAQYYNLNGTLAWSRTFTIGSAAVAGFHQSLDGVPDGWQGSIILSATDVIVAVMREDTLTTVNGYNGIPR